MSAEAAAPSAAGGGGGRDTLLAGRDIALAVGGRLLNGSPDAVVGGVSIDTRTLKPGDLYVAIRGERFDGHAFVEAALAAGASGVIVSDPPAVPPALMGTRLLVAAADTTRALQALARWVRRRSGAHVVAITGSAGKTTTKEIAAAFLELRHRVMRSSGNLNNHIGLPLSLLELRHGADVAVVELGMNHAGEIRTLVGIAEPDMRVWTNVAEVHSEFFDSIDAIADAKAEVLDGATAATVLVANADDPLVMRRTRGFIGRTVTFSAGGDAAASVVATGIEGLGLDGMRAIVRTPAGATEWRVPLLGRGNLHELAGGPGDRPRVRRAVGRDDRAGGQPPAGGAPRRGGQAGGRCDGRGRRLQLQPAGAAGRPGGSRGGAAATPGGWRSWARCSNWARRARRMHEACGRAAAGVGLVGARRRRRTSRPAPSRAARWRRVWTLPSSGTCPRATRPPTSLRRWFGRGTWCW